MNMKEYRLTNGCDKLSRVYEDMLNALQEVLKDEDKLKNLSPLDYSALGLYIGKFVEQEINSSVVQIMRSFRGVKMPKYYCKRFPRYVSPVKTDRQEIFLNSKKYVDDSTSLKTISLGDAYHALMVLKSEDNNGFFDQYSWLSNQTFLDAWRELSKFRNKMAHIGEIIDSDVLKENYEVFHTFLNFMPDITKAKKNLAPKGYRQPLKRVNTSSNRKNDLPIASIRCMGIRFEEESKIKVKSKYDDIKQIGLIAEEERKAKELYLKRHERNGISISRIKDKFLHNVVKVFKKRNGGKGLKSIAGSILVPPNYDEFGFIPITTDDYQRKSVIAIRDDKYILVTLDGSGKELTTEKYDEIKLADNKLMNSPYVYRKNGRTAWGCMDEWGKEMCDNIIDSYVCSEKGLTYESNELRGYWHFAEPTSPFLPPIFDDIEKMDSQEEPLLFILNGIEGHVKIVGDGFEFISLSELNKLDAMRRKEALECCIREDI